MSTYPVANDFSAQADGTTLTTSNATGTGNTNFDGVTIAAGAALKFSTDQVLNGTRSLKVSNGTATTLTRAHWQEGSAQSRIGGRGYYYVTGYHTTTYYPIRFTDTGGTLRMAIGFTSASKLSIQDSAFNTVATSTNSLPTNTWYRIEWDVTFSTSANPQVKVFTASPHTSTALETLSPTGVNLGATTAQRVEYGITANITTGIPDYYLAHPFVLTSGFPGAIAVPLGIAQEADNALVMTVGGGAAAVSHAPDLLVLGAG